MSNCVYDIYSGLPIHLDIVKSQTKTKHNLICLKCQSEVYLRGNKDVIHKEKECDNTLITLATKLLERHINSGGNITVCCNICGSLRPLNTNGCVIQTNIKVDLKEKIYLYRGDKGLSSTKTDNKSILSQSKGILSSISQYSLDFPTLSESQFMSPVPERNETLFRMKRDKISGNDILDIAVHSGTRLKYVFNFRHIPNMTEKTEGWFEFRRQEVIEKLRDKITQDLSFSTEHNQEDKFTTDRSYCQKDKFIPDRSYPQERKSVTLIDYRRCTCSNNVKKMLDLAVELGYCNVYNEWTNPVRRLAILAKPTQGYRITQKWSLTFIVDMIELKSPAWAEAWIEFMKRGRCLKCNTLTSVALARPYCLKCISSIKRNPTETIEIQLDRQLLNKLEHYFNWLQRIPNLDVIDPNINGGKCSSCHGKTLHSSRCKEKVIFGPCSSCDRISSYVWYYGHRPMCFSCVRDCHFEYNPHENYFTANTDNLAYIVSQYGRK
jgi:hypothetical protein